MPTTSPLPIFPRVCSYTAGEGPTASERVRCTWASARGGVPVDLAEAPRCLPCSLVGSCSAGEPSWVTERRTSAHTDGSVCLSPCGCGRMCGGMI